MSRCVTMSVVGTDIVASALLFDRSIGIMYSNSTLNITAVMITAASVALGMKAQAGMRTTRARMTMRPVKTPPAVVFTPLELLTAVRENEPVVG